ncbi:hypothetical protein AU05_19055 [Ectopseudomonas composti]|uniref:Uncharacterized protein n=1 Tax=Ectopseudomonas composti TaxID=658457 RepID=A0ABN0S9J6_9GAMM|nr:hypothetical protein AU05_19055 [Pseudomonas composti]
MGELPGVAPKLCGQLQGEVGGAALQHEYAVELSGLGGGEASCAALQLELGFFRRMGHVKNEQNNDDSNDSNEQLHDDFLIS